MVKKIERFNWNSFPEAWRDALDRWFDENIEPINRALDEAVVVYGENDDCWFEDHPHEFNKRTHKALLINIEPIQQETCADVLRAIIHDSEKMQDFVLTPQEIERAKAALERENK